MPRKPAVQAGEKYGRLTVVEFHSTTSANKRRYLCRCECGTEAVVVGSNLRSGNAKSCGCLQREKAAQSAESSARTAIGPGVRFGILTVIGKAESESSGRARYLCSCDCGGEVTTLAASLREGRTRSCGCLRRETTRERGYANRKHGHAGGPKATRAYYTWVNMKARCENPNHKSYADYGGRGIKVCDRWQTFENFLEDMGEPPVERTLDRIDNEAGYSKANCRWATWIEQASNRRPRSPNRRSPTTT